MNKPDYILKARSSDRPNAWSVAKRRWIEKDARVAYVPGAVSRYLEMLAEEPEPGPVLPEITKESIERCLDDARDEYGPCEFEQWVADGAQGRIYMSDRLKFRTKMRFNRSIFRNFDGLYMAGGWSFRTPQEARDYLIEDELHWKYALPRKDLEIIRMRGVEQMRFPEIAWALRLTTSCVHMRFKAACKRSKHIPSDVWRALGVSDKMRRCIQSGGQGSEWSFNRA